MPTVCPMRIASPLSFPGQRVFKKVADRPIDHLPAVLNFGPCSDFWFARARKLAFPRGQSANFRAWRLRAENRYHCYRYRSYSTSFEEGADRSNQGRRLLRIISRWIAVRKESPDDADKKEMSETKPETDWNLKEYLEEEPWCIRFEHVLPGSNWDVLSQKCVREPLCIFLDEEEHLYFISQSVDLVRYIQLSNRENGTLHCFGDRRVVVPAIATREPSIHSSPTWIETRGKILAVFLLLFMAEFIGVRNLNILAASAVFAISVPNSNFRPLAAQEIRAYRSRLANLKGLIKHFSVSFWVSRPFRRKLDFAGMLH